MGDRPVRVGVLGASGYSGGEVVRLLLGHPGVRIGFIGGRDSAGRTLADVHPHLAGARVGSLRVHPVEEVNDVDVVLSALPNGSCAGLAPTLLERGIRLIDLSGDHRLSASAYPVWYGFEHPAPAWLDKAVYGLPELFRDQIRGAALVANPGCFPTPVVLGLVPLLRERLIEAAGIVVDGKTGLSGAGRGAGGRAAFAVTQESVRPYRFPRHQHTPEMERALELGTGIRASVSFVPHLVPAVRGVLVTAYARAGRDVTPGSPVDALASAYEDEPFVRVLPPGEMTDAKRVRGSNVVELQAALDGRTGTVVVVGTVDNLVKGAAGQAIQNLNLMAGFDETTALPTVGMYP
ncbi:MAG TPA: N-acetyl-gamma-glutamyl-phosphate reductase [Actinomycetota bacterium]|nr:N-acetyl-gamma-glutamyl-phosphate reductase [Actinomycetota bacterium]